eukprot:g8967.t1
MAIGLLPLCSLSTTRIKVMKFALTYQSTRQVLMERCKVLRSAAEESRRRRRWNRPIAVVRFQSVGCISCMHFLCITMRASDTRFLSGLEASLKNVNFAQARLREMTVELPKPKGHSPTLEAKAAGSSAVNGVEELPVEGASTGGAEDSTEDATVVEPEPWPEVTEEVPRTVRREPPAVGE